MASFPSQPRVTMYSKPYSARLRAEFAKRTKRAAEVLRQQLRQNLSVPGGGKPSKPGEFPRKQTGKLMGGVRTEVGESELSWVVTNKMPYNAHLEYGTKGGKVIVPRSAKCLRFAVFKGAKRHTVFVKRVVQGPIEARKQARRTIVECRAKLKAIYLRGLGDRQKAKGVLRVG